MIMDASSSSPSSSSATRQWKYDVFLSFRGEDTRYNFTSHLYAALRHKSIDTFMDDQLPRGDEISSSLLNTIRASRISIIIFSENYAGSRWCLQELAEILECKRTCGQIVMPIFYHVDPTHVRNQTGAFGEAFASLQKRFKERSNELKRWKSALEEAANLSGSPITGQTSENVIKEEIVGDILRRLNNLCPSDNSKGLVGVDESQQKIESLLHLGSNGVRIVGIWGVGGIGKTTISNAVFQKISGQFESCYFAKNVREMSVTSGGVSSLKSELFSTLLGEKDIDVNCSYTYERLCRKKFLVVFDDVTCFQQIEDLIGDFTCLHLRSRIIITSRNKQVLRNCGAEDINIYEVIGLCNDDALQLFSKYAFKWNHPLEGFMDLSMEIVKYSKGVPLALKVLGSCLFRKTEENWKSQIGKLENCPHEDIFKVLKISYDGLNYEEKQIFLDIACFLKGESKSLVEKILDASNFSSSIGLSNLVDKSLITISYEETTKIFDKSLITMSYEKTTEIITMHDLLQEMGKEIVRQESPDDPGKRSRLWHPDDVDSVLQRNTGTERVRGISLCTDVFANKRCFRRREKYDIKLDRDSLTNMRNLRFFYAKYFENFQGFEDLDKFFAPSVFIWDSCPLKSLQFNVENLGMLKLNDSRVEKLWNGIQDLVNLKYVDLSSCVSLRKIPNLSKARNLQELILKDCSSLSEINSASIEHLDKLVRLDLSMCSSLISFPDFIQSKSIDLLGCGRLRIVPKISKNVEEFIWNTKQQKEWPVILDPSRLVRLEIFRFSAEATIPDNLSRFSFLQYLHLAFSDFESLPPSTKDLSNLRLLNIGYCERLKTLPELPRGIDLRADGCSSLESISDLSFLISSKLRPQKVTFAKCFKLNLSKILHEEPCREFCGYLLYPGCELPKWFSIQRAGPYVTLEQLPDWENKNFIGFFICVAVKYTGLGHHNLLADITCNLYIKTKDDEIKKHMVLSIHQLFLASEHVLLGFAWPITVSTPQKKSYVSMHVMKKMRNAIALIQFTTRPHYGFKRPKVRACGVHFLYAQDCEEPTGGLRATFSSSNSRLSQLCSASTTSEGQPISFPWDLNETPQDFDGSKTDVIATTSPNLEDYNGTELGGTQRSPKRCKR